MWRVNSIRVTSATTVRMPSTRSSVAPLVTESNGSNGINARNSPNGKMIGARKSAKSAIGATASASPNFGRWKPDGPLAPATDLATTST